MRRSPSDVTQLNWMTRRSPENGLCPCQELSERLKASSSSGGGRDLHDRIVEVRGRFQEPETPARMLPFRVHVEQDRDDLALRVGMDAAVPGTAVAANRDRMRPASEVEAELVLEGFAELVARHLIEQFAKVRPVRQLGDRKAARLGDLRIVPVDFAAGPGTDEAGHDEVLERRLGQRRRLQRFQVEIRQSHRNDSRAGLRRGGTYWLRRSVSKRGRQLAGCCDLEK